MAKKPSIIIDGDVETILVTGINANDLPVNLEVRGQKRLSLSFLRASSRDKYLPILIN